MTALASDLSIRLGSPVIDRTETTGHYDFSVDVSPDDIHLGRADENPANGPSVFDSIQRLGLKLKSQKVPLDVIVVDYVEKVPVENYFCNAINSRWASFPRGRSRATRPALCARPV